MDSLGILEKILVEIERRQTAVVLVGGWALNFHGMPRQTLDLDLMIAAENLPAATAALELCAYCMVFQSELFARFRDQAAGSPDIDLLFVSPETLRTVTDSGRHVAVGNATVTIPSLDHMLAMKLHALKYNYPQRATKDLPDVANLLRLRGWRPDSPEFADLVKRFGSPAIVERLRLLITEDGA
ncbi:MAG: hypothetical protein A3K19_05050 [Lentisphaerae bacterium RIFOXYB12_FULL_65_16]|nr:MAG: hypothetical protein A3K18_35300 [Lentisphaerae bacterium RIFOXYA12_64_32]OGV89756.1 MAG: hypothetical protein A3K19_05050 [Lentisphaerae bacterium RIFOXYB12_FULL_65_16]